MIAVQKTIGFLQAGDSQKNARRRVKLATGVTFGSRQMSTVILPPSERWRDWFLIVLAIAMFSGVLPALASCALVHIAAAVGPWPVWAALAAFSAAFLRWVWSL